MNIRVAARLLAGAVAAAVVVGLALRDDGEGRPTAAVPTLVGLEASQVRRVVLESGDHRADLVRGEGSWLAAPGTPGQSATLMYSLEDELFPLRAYRAVVGDPADPQYGLATPEMSVTISDGSGRDTVFVVGRSELQRRRRLRPPPRPFPPLPRAPPDDRPPPFRPHRPGGGLRRPDRRAGRPVRRRAATRPKGRRRSPPTCSRSWTPAGRCRRGQDDRPGPPRPAGLPRRRGGRGRLLGRRRREDLGGGRRGRRAGHPRNRDREAAPRPPRRGGDGRRREPRARRGPGGAGRSLRAPLPDQTRPRPPPRRRDGPARTASG